MKAYELVHGQWLGSFVEISPKDGWPTGWIVTEASPAIGDVWTGQAWEAPTVEDLTRIAEAKRIANVPASISPRQFRQALTRAGLRNAAEALVAASSQDVKDWYQTASDFQPRHPILLSMAEALGKTQLDIDNLFTLGGSL